MKPSAFRILLVEDDPNDAYFLLESMTEAGLQPPIHVAVDGQHAIDYLIVTSLVDPFKHTKEAILVLGFDADAVVLDPKTNMAVVEFGPDFDFRRDARRHEFDRISEEVRYGLSE